MRIVVASDHAGFCQKDVICDFVRGLGHEVEDLGPETADRVDYPDFADKVARRVSEGDKAAKDKLTAPRTAASSSAARVSAWP